MPAKRPKQRLELPPIVTPISIREPVSRDVSYGDEPGSVFDVYMPDQAPTVVVILWHGESPEAEESWSTSAHVKECGSLVSWASLLAKRGVSVVVPNHRTSSGWLNPTIVEDDLSYIVEAAASHPWFAGADVAILAFSGGVPLVVTNASRLGIARIVSMYGCLDLSEPEYLLLLPAAVPASRSLRNPINAVSGDTPPHLHVWPRKDWLPNGAENYLDKAQEVGARFELVVHEEGQHGFDFLDDNDRSREIIEKVARFLAGG